VITGVVYGLNMDLGPKKKKKIVSYNQEFLISKFVTMNHV